MIARKIETVHFLACLHHTGLWEKAKNQSIFLSKLRTIAQHFHSINVCKIHRFRFDERKKFSFSLWVVLFFHSPFLHIIYIDFFVLLVIRLTVIKVNEFPPMILYFIQNMCMRVFFSLCLCAPAAYMIKHIKNRKKIKYIQIEECIMLFLYSQQYQCIWTLYQMSAIHISEKRQHQKKTAK